jgi:hypothetical protein
LVYFEENNKKFLPLMLALHAEMDSNHVVDTLRFHQFEISSLDFDKLNQAVKKNPHLQGGLCDDSRDTLHIYDGKDTFQFSVSK